MQRTDFAKKQIVKRNMNVTRTTHVHQHLRRSANLDEMPGILAFPHHYCLISTVQHTHCSHRHLPQHPSYSKNRYCLYTVYIYITFTYYQE